MSDKNEKPDLNRLAKPEITPDQLAAQKSSNGSHKETGQESAAKQNWWDDPSFPWNGKPNKAELWCYGAIIGYGIYGLIMMPLRPLLLTIPWLAVALNGSTIGLAAIGAQTQVGQWPLWSASLFIVIAAISGIKWDWIYWWGGKLWGQKFVESVGGKSKRTKAISDKIGAYTRRHPFFAIFLAGLPIPFTAVIMVVVGTAGISLKKFLVLEFFVAAFFYTGYFALGYYFGQTAISILEIYNNYALIISVIVLIGVVGTAIAKTAAEEKRKTAAK